jgi:hypothetical protein
MFGNQNQSKCVVCNASVKRGTLQHLDASVCVAINAERENPTITAPGTLRVMRQQAQHEANQARKGQPSQWQQPLSQASAALEAYYARLAARLNAYFDEKAARGRPFEEGRKKALEDLAASASQNSNGQYVPVFDARSPWERLSERMSAESAGVRDNT